MNTTNRNKRIKTHAEMMGWEQIEEVRRRDAYQFYLVGATVTAVIILWAILLCGGAHAQPIQPAEAESITQAVLGWVMVGMTVVVFCAMGFAPMIRQGRK